MCDIHLYMFDWFDVQQIINNVKYQLMDIKLNVVVDNMTCAQTSQKLFHELDVVNVK